MTDPWITVHDGDALDVLATLPPASVDAVVTDPPYNLAFMGRAWDSVGGPAGFAEWCHRWAAECFRALKPGGHLLAFGGTRTYHRMVCGIEDAGFEVRDSITWLYGQGFPKSLNLGDGRGTALKPASEPIVVARKPLSGTVAANVTEYGTGALNIDACRTSAGQDYRDKCASVVGIGSNRNGDAYGEWAGVRTDSAHVSGRWPTNVVLSHAATPDGGDACADGCVDGCPIAELDAQSGVSTSGRPREMRGSGGIWSPSTDGIPVGPQYGDTGGASRFFPTFRYQAKAPTRERPKVDGVAHPTVKPLALMRWLVRLVTPPAGVVLDPFAGSGTTVEAAALEGFRVVAVEKEPDYVHLIRARIARIPHVQTALPLETP